MGFIDFLKNKGNKNNAENTQPQNSGRPNTAQQAETTYTVQSGDSLSKIAKKYYGDPMKYLAIFDANRNILNDPDKIYPGQVLKIPKAQ